MQQLIALPKLNPPITYSGSHSSLTSSTCSHHVTKTSGLSHQHTVAHLAHPLPNLVTKSTTTAKRKGDSTDPWCIPTLTSNSSDNSESTITLVFAPSYRLITGQTKTSGIPFFLIAYSNTFLGTLSKAFSRSTKYMLRFSFSMMLFLHSSM